MFSAVLTGAFRETEVGIGISFCTKGSVFDLWRLQAKTKVTSDTANDLLFADDCALNAASKGGMKPSFDKFVKACNNCGLTINIKKTEAIHQPAPGKPYAKTNISINGQQPASQSMGSNQHLNQWAATSISVNGQQPTSQSMGSNQHINQWATTNISINGQQPTSQSMGSNQHLNQWATTNISINGQQPTYQSMGSNQHLNQWAAVDKFTFLGSSL